MNRKGELGVLGLSDESMDAARSFGTAIQKETPKMAEDSKAFAHFF